MKGYVDEFGQPKMEIILIGESKRLTTEAVIDTGFNGELSIPVNMAIELGLKLIALEKVELADGCQRNEMVFSGKILWEKLERDVNIFVTYAGEPLIGTMLLGGQDINISFYKKTVSIRYRSDHPMNG